MSSKVYPYRSNRQFEKYIGQFARVFTGFQVRDGVSRGGDVRMKTIPVIYGNMSRVVATVLSKRNHNVSTQIPIMAVNMTTIQKDIENLRTPHHKDAVSLIGIGKDATMHRLIGPSFTMGMELSIYASSMEELFEILEQILLIFNPRVTIRVDNDAVNADCITDIILRDIQPEFQYPMGDSSQVIMMTLGFDVPVRLNYPSEVDYDTLIKTIHAKIIDDNNGEILSTLDIDENGLIEEEHF